MQFNNENGFLFSFTNMKLIKIQIMFGVTLCLVDFAIEEKLMKKEWYVMTGPHQHQRWWIMYMQAYPIRSTRNPLAAGEGWGTVHHFTSTSKFGLWRHVSTFHSSPKFEMWTKTWDFDISMDKPSLPLLLRHKVSIGVRHLICDLFRTEVQ